MGREMPIRKPELNEGQLKRAVEDYLTYQMNLGKLYYDRLNSGEIIVLAGKSRRRVKLCREGTADFIVVKRWWPLGAPNKWEPQVIFLETKSPKGKTTKEQDEFAEKVEGQGAAYAVIRSIEELQEIL